MAPTFVKTALSLLSFASIAFSTGVAATDSVCATSSKCIPFTIDVTLGTAPGGVPRQAILTNGTLPGPPLKLKVGDCVDFTVINNLPYVTAVHFHGIRQLGSAWADGTPGLSQRPIPAGESYMYQWNASDYGTYFYHAHYKGQMFDGLYGAIIIEPADDAPTPFSQISSSDSEKLSSAFKDLTPVFIGDWSQFTFEQYFAAEKAANVDATCTDSIVINGMGSSYCLSPAVINANANPLTPRLLSPNTTLTAKGCIPASNPLLQGPFKSNLAALPPGVYDQCTSYSGANYTLEVDAKNGWAAISLINSGGIFLLQVSIDGHKLYVFENDGHFVNPQVVDQIPIATGDRVSFFVKLDQPAANYQIRVANTGINQVISGFGVLKYKGAGSNFGGVATQNIGGVNTTTVSKFLAATAGPFPPETVSQKVDKTFVLDILKSPAQPNDAWAWSLDGFDSYNHSRDDQTPLLYQNPSAIPDSKLVLRTNYNDWVDLIIKVEGPLAQPHPMHKHANKFYMIGAGVGPFNYTSVAQAQAAGIPFNFAAAPYVDGFTSSPAQGTAAWMVFRYQANTPGAWFFHCHIQTHFSGGMAVAILDGVDKWPYAPKDAGKVCAGTGETGHCCYEEGTCGPNGAPANWGNGTSPTNGGFYPTAASTGTSPAATSSYGSAGWGSPNATNSAGVATYTGAASSTVKTSLTSAFGLVAVFFALYA